MIELIKTCECVYMWYAVNWIASYILCDSVRVLWSQLALHNRCVVTTVILIWSYDFLIIYASTVLCALTVCRRSNKLNCISMCVRTYDKTIKLPTSPTHTARNSISWECVIDAIASVLSCDFDECIRRGLSIREYKLQLHVRYLDCNWFSMWFNWILIKMFLQYL